jgi:uncharacterized protein YjbI with pentapeptide repeats
LDGQRKGEVVRFLYEAGLLRRKNPLPLNGADLRDADLVRSDFFDASLAATNLRGAHFGYSSLGETDFSDAHLPDASFWRSDLSGVQFDFADLTGANFAHAELGSTTLERTCLSEASFVGAKLVHVDLRDSEGRAVDFSDARFLRLVSVKGAGFTDVKLDGAQGIPRGWGPTVLRNVKKSQAQHPCTDRIGIYTTNGPLLELPPRPKKKK